MLGRIAPGSGKAGSPEGPNLGLLLQRTVPACWARRGMGGTAFAASESPSDVLTLVSHGTPWSPSWGGQCCVHKGSKNATRLLLRTNEPTKQRKHQTAALTAMMLKKSSSPRVSRIDETVCFAIVRRSPFMLPLTSTNMTTSFGEVAAWMYLGRRKIKWK